jgi:hypothetical protein
MICSEGSDVRFAKLLVDFPIIVVADGRMARAAPWANNEFQQCANCDELDLARPWQYGKLCEDRFWHSSDKPRPPANRLVSRAKRTESRPGPISLTYAVRARNGVKLYASL